MLVWSKEEEAKLDDITGELEDAISNDDNVFIKVDDDSGLSLDDILPVVEADIDITLLDVGSICVDKDAETEEGVAYNVDVDTTNSLVSESIPLIGS